jgi:hypothetical protein
MPWCRHEPDTDPGDPAVRRRGSAGLLRAVRGLLRRQPLHRVARLQRPDRSGKGGAGPDPWRPQRQPAPSSGRLPPARSALGSWRSGHTEGDAQPRSDRLDRGPLPRGDSSSRVRVGIFASGSAANLPGTRPVYGRAAPRRRFSTGRRHRWPRSRWRCRRSPWPRP